MEDKAYKSGFKLRIFQNSIEECAEDPSSGNSSLSRAGKIFTVLPKIACGKGLVFQQTQWKLSKK
jgi:hypothetical protein